MKIEKILIMTLVALAIGGFAWSLVGFFSNKNSASLVENTLENFARAVQVELIDKCKAPEGYTEEQWQEHMSHHPDRYRECFLTQEEKVMINYKDIEANDLANMLEMKDFELIDVHIPEQAHIPGTDQFIPFNEIVARQSKLPQDKDAKVVVYCRSGSMSRMASEVLIEMGYTNVYNLVGGINGWQRMGYEVEDVFLW